MSRSSHPLCSAKMPLCVSHATQTSHLQLHRFHHLSNVLPPCACMPSRALASTLAMSLIDLRSAPDLRSAELDIGPSVWIRVAHLWAVRRMRVLECVLDEICCGSESLTFDKCLHVLTHGFCVLLKQLSCALLTIEHFNLHTQTLTCSCALTPACAEAWILCQGAAAEKGGLSCYRPLFHAALRPVGLHPRALFAPAAGGLCACKSECVHACVLVSFSHEDQEVKLALQNHSPTRVLFMCFNINTTQIDHGCLPFAMLWNCSSKRR